jgi:4'-phosphopantetheinyl transferase
MADAGRAPAPRLWLVDLDAPPGPAGVLDAQEARRAESFVTARLRRRYVAGRTALRVVLGDALGLPPREVPLETGPLGKPRLAGEPSLWFNLAHCEGLGVIALTSAGAVGVDVESPARVREPRALSARFFAPAEAAVIARLPEAQAARAFVRCWTAKEAVLKAIGVGLTRPLRDVVVEPVGELRLRRTPPPLRPGDWTLHAPALAGRMVVAVAVAAPSVPAPELRRLGPGG